MCPLTNIFGVLRRSYEINLNSHGRKRIMKSLIGTINVSMFLLRSMDLKTKEIFGVEVFSVHRM